MQVRQTLTLTQPKKQIDALGDITLASEDAIAEARAAYNALTDLQKMQVNNYETLQKAEEKLAELKEDAAKVKCCREPD